MNTKLLTLFTRTPLHVGAGASVGAVDQPVVRERHTGYPVIPGSALKGVLSDLWLDRTDSSNPVRTKIGKQLFGEDNLNANAAAGKLLVGESKLLAFPIRSAKGCFAWITCPMVLARFDRDTRKRLGVPCVEVGKGETKVSPGTDVFLSFNNAKTVVFEEYSMTASADENVAALAGILAPLCSDIVWGELVAKKLTVVDDETFAYFARNACEVAQHNRINDKTNTVDGTGFFNQENVPSETLFYALVASDDETLLKEQFEPKIQSEEILQIGADMTTGLGWCSVTLTPIG